MASILKVNTIQDATNSTTAMSVDTAGRVNFPTLPRISVSHSTNGGVSYSTGDQYVDSSTVVHNITAVGITFDGSNGRFTLPVAGDYHVHYFTMAYGGSSVVSEWAIRLNDTNKFRGYVTTNGNYWKHLSCGGIITATAGQYVNVQCTGSGATYESHGGTYSGFSMHLLG